MKTILIGFLAVLALGMGAATARAQPRFAIVGQACSGGGTAEGGRFQITGTIGQPEASPRLSSRCLSIAPGFWGRYAVVPTPGAPALRIRPLDFNYMRVSFVPGCGEWVLQWTRTLDPQPAATVWSDDSPNNLMAVGSELVRDFHVPSWGPLLFFRLRQVAE